MVLILFAQSQESLCALAGLCVQHLYRSMLLQSWSHRYLITIRLHNYTMCNCRLHNGVTLFDRYIYILYTFL